MENRYGELAAWVYHLDKPIGRSFGDLEYYQARLDGCTGPILEPAVGNGRIFIPLLEAGFDVEGFDLSEDMLNYCRKECVARHLSPKLTRQAFHDFGYEKKFEAIVIPAGSFQLVTDFDSAMAVLHLFYKHLLPGGRLILDIDPMNVLIEPSHAMRSWKVSEDELLTLMVGHPEIDYAKQTSLSYLRYEHWKNGKLIMTELDPFCLRWWGIRELALALKDVGFVNLVVSGGYEHGKTPLRDDFIISFEAQRPENG